MTRIWASCLAAVILLIQRITAESELVMLVELFRHGARRELDNFPPLRSIPSLSEIYPDPFTGKGDLSAVGFRAHYLLGKAIRKKYKDFLPDQYRPDNLQVYASNRNRTIESANSQLLGLYDFGSGYDIDVDKKELYQPPIKDFDIEFEGLSALPKKMQLVPVQTPDNISNWMFGADTDCPNVKSNMNLSFNTIVDKYNSTFTPLYNVLVKNNFDPRYYLDKDHYDLKDAMKICDYIFTNIWNNINFKFEAELQEHCEVVLNLQLFARFSSEDVRKVYLSKIMTKIKQTLKDKSEGKLDALKFLMLSGHDSNVSAFFNVFRPNNYECIINEYKNKYESDGSIKKDWVKDESCIDKIRFTANIIIELRKNVDSKEFFVRLLYNNKEMAILENGKAEQPLDEFFSIFGQFELDDYEESCGVKVDDNMNISNLLLIVLILSLLALFLALIILIYYISKAKQVDSRGEFERVSDIEQNIQQNPLIQV